MSKFVYVLPKYEETTAKHYYYEYELLASLAEEHNLRVIVEKGDEMDIDGTYRQSFSFPPLRALELLLVLLWYRLLGYETTYTHYSYYGGIVTGALSTALGGTAYYWNCEETETVLHTDLDSVRGLKNKLRDELPMRLSLAFTDVLVTGTETMVDYYQDHYGLREDEVAELPNWVDEDRFAALPSSAEARDSLGLPRDRPIVLYLHKLGPKKGADAIPELAARIRKKLPDTLFVVVGNGPSREQLEREVRRRGLTETVRFEGNVRNDRALEYFRAADVYALPSRAEGFPRVLLESMAAGCPFVATDVGGIGEFAPAEAREYLVQYGQWEAFSDNLVELLEDDETREAVVAAGTRVADHFDRAYVLSRFDELLSSRER